MVAGLILVGMGVYSCSVFDQQGVIICNPGELFVGYILPGATSLMCGIYLCSRGIGIFINLKLLIVFVMPGIAFLVIWILRASGAIEIDTGLFYANGVVGYMIGGGLATWALVSRHEV